MCSHPRKPRRNPFCYGMCVTHGLTHRILPKHSVLCNFISLDYRFRHPKAINIPMEPFIYYKSAMSLSAVCDCGIS